MHHLAIERELFDRAMRMQQDRHARALVDAARLDSDVAILDQVDAADAVASGDLVGALDQRGRREPLAVYRDRIAARVFDFDVLGLRRARFAARR